MSNLNYTEKKFINSSPYLDDIIAYMKNTAKQYINTGLYSNALFYADKIFYLSLNKDRSVISDNLFELSQCLYLNKEYLRCVNLIQKYNLVYYNLKYLNLLGQALLACEDYEGVINYLDRDFVAIENEETENLNFQHSVRYLLVGKAYEMQENKTQAKTNFLSSLKCDSGNIEAFESLITHQLLSNEEKTSLKKELQFNKLNRWLHDYYTSKLEDNIFITLNSEVVTHNEENRNIIDILYIKNDQDLMKIEAEKFFTARDYTSAYNKLKKINDQDAYKFDIIPMYCSCMIELNKVGELYYLAHKLTNSCSDRYISWFVVGCYYYCVKKYDIARKYFTKCNQINKHMPEGWIALGNCFAAQDESDQAQAAYRTCLRLFPGCPYANLYFGMEYLRINNLKTALVAFQDALKISNKDPLVYNEIGTVFYKQKFYVEAQSHYIRGLELCLEDKSLISQTLTVNLGHTFRKLRKYDDAITAYSRVMKMDNRNVSVISALAYTYHLKGDYAPALDLYHKANFIKSDDSFVAEMISKCLNDMLELGE